MLDEKNANKTYSFIEIERGIYMMVDYGYCFAMALQQRLKSKIKGRIFVAVNDDDVLFINITNKDETVFKISFNNFANRLYNGWTSEYAAYEVISEYRKKLFDRYFYHD